jgi:hypothetical protein
VVRASLVAERIGIRSVSVTCQGFVGQAKALARMSGFASIAIATYPGLVMIDSDETLEAKARGSLVDDILAGLAERQVALAAPPSYDPSAVIFRGDYDEIQEHFLDRMWGDGLPIVPPTDERVERFLRYTDRPAPEVLGVLLPENREATVWNCAVNGVMAGCRPEYMPVLIAIAEAISRPSFRMEDAGSTPGWEPLITVSGPIIKELAFNSGPGVMRVGRQANTSIGRFIRLYMRNVAGLRIPPGTTDKATIGSGMNVVLAEDEDAVRTLGWPTYGVDRGSLPDASLVTVESCIAVSPPIYSGGSTAADHLETITDLMGALGSSWTHQALRYGGNYALLVLNPSVASVFAREGLTKNDIRASIQRGARMPFQRLARLAHHLSAATFPWADFAREFGFPDDYGTPPADGTVPVFPLPEHIDIVVAGDPSRNQSRAYLNNNRQAPPTSAEIQLPAAWNSLPKGPGSTRERS